MMRDGRELGGGDEIESREIDDEGAAVCAPIVIPHHLACVPRRQPRPWTRPDRVAPAVPRSVLEDWKPSTIRTAEDGGAVRTNFTYRNSFDTSATFSVKARRAVYGEGAYEALYQRILATDPATVEYRFQIAELSWETADGAKRTYTPDGGRITEDGREIWFEIKRDASFFEEPTIRDLLDQAEAVLSQHDIALERIAGIDLMDPVRMHVIGQILRWKAVPIADHVPAIASLLVQEGGTTTLGRVHAAISNNATHAHAIACSMLVHRVIGFAVDAPLSPHTVVWQPKAPKRRLSLHLGKVA